MKTIMGKELYSVKEAYWIFYRGVRTMKFMIKAKRHNDFDMQKIERIMLAVTEVNGCAVCSYAHTKMALEAGISHEEIHNLLTGDFDTGPKAEMTGVLFAQHYADSRGNPSQASWENVKTEYGHETALGILGAIRVIMIGNTYGIPWSSFFNRFKGKADPRSSLGYELSMMTVGTLLIPFALVHAAVASLMKQPVIAFPAAKQVS